MITRKRPFRMSEIGSKPTPDLPVEFSEFSGILQG